MNEQEIRERATTYTKAVMDGLTKAGLSSAEAVGEAALRCMVVADAERNEAYGRGYQIARSHWKARAEQWKREADYFRAAATALGLSSSEPVTAGPEVREPCHFHEAEVDEAKCTCAADVLYPEPVTAGPEACVYHHHFEAQARCTCPAPEPAGEVTPPAETFDPREQAAVYLEGRLHRAARPTTEGGQ